MLEERGFTESKRLGEQAWETGKNPGPQEARPQENPIQDATISASAIPHLLEMTTGHHADPMSCPRCFSFIFTSGCTGLDGKVHGQVLEPLFHIPGGGESEIQTVWHPQWKVRSYIPRSHAMKNSLKCKDRWILTAKGML